MSINKAILIGHIGQDPEVRTMQNGDKICSFSLATSENWTDKATGEKKEKTEWHRIVIWNQNLVSIAERWLRKGSKIYLEGKITTRKYTGNDGIEKYTTEITLDRNPVLEMLGERSARQQGEAGSAGSQSTAINMQSPAGLSPSKIAERDASKYRTASLDDDIPF